MLTAGGEAGGDWISRTLSGTTRLPGQVCLGNFSGLLGKTAAVYPGLRFDYYSNFGTSVNPSLSGSWWMLPRLRLRSSVGRAFRIPTFTELYYRDPNHEATPYAQARKRLVGRSRHRLHSGKELARVLTLYSRQERNVIDWIRTSAGEKWRTANIRQLLTSGAEISLEHSLGSRARIAARYSRISIDAGNFDFTSKYVLDYARDSWSASASFPMPFAFAYQQTASYKRRADGRSYWLLDGRLERHFRKFTAAIGSHEHAEQRVPGRRSASTCPAAGSHSKTIARR